MLTAQQAFARMMKVEIAPALRRLGFRGSGQAYQLTSETAWAILGFQKSKYSDSSQLEFTINLTVIDRHTWAQARTERPYLPERPAANTYSGVGWQQRIGTLLPGKNTDHWWTVTGDASSEPVAEDVVRVVEQFALPALRKRL